MIQPKNACSMTLFYSCMLKMFDKVETLRQSQEMQILNFIQDNVIKKLTRDFTSYQSLA